MSQNSAFAALIQLGGIATTRDIEILLNDEHIGHYLRKLYYKGEIGVIESCITLNKGGRPKIWYTLEQEIQKPKQSLKEKWKIQHQKHKEYRNEYCLGYYYLNRDRILAQMRERYQRMKMQ